MPSRSATQALITGGIVTWARQRIKLSEQQLAKELGVHEGVILKWENGEAQPDLQTAQRLADALHIPFGYLFLTRTPKDVEIPDLRTVGSRPLREFSPHLLDHVRNVMLMQEWYRDHLLSRGSKALTYVGSASLRDNPETVAASITRTLGITAHMRENAANATDYLDTLMARCEAAGILTMRSGVVGNSGRRLSVKEFRGLVLSDKYAPLVFLNSNDSQAAQIFTLAHEVAHLWIDRSGISNTDFKRRAIEQANVVERFCNRVASQVLTPREEFERRWFGSDSTDTKIARAKRYFGVSSLVILRQAYDLGKLSKEEYERRVDKEEAAFKRVQEGRPKFLYLVQSRHSRSLTKSVLEAVGTGSLALRDAASLLNCKVPTLRTLALEMK